MTPEERKAARVALRQCVRSAYSGAFIHEVASCLCLALDQIDADEKRRADEEALMRMALEAALALMPDYAFGVGREVRPLLDKANAAIMALRARLSDSGRCAGEEPAAPEAPGQEAERHAGGANK